MDQIVEYQCGECGSRKKIQNQSEAPVCCGQEMKKPDGCTKQAVAEHYRSGDEDGPCDDGR